MRKSVVYSVLFILVGFLSSVSLVPAATAGGSTPAAAGVCDALAADGVTKGLYGLCVAYCEAEASSHMVLENYNRKRQDGDPAMPCLDDPPVTCPCWSADDLVNAFSEMEPFLCFTDPVGLDAAFYDGFNGQLTAGIDTDGSLVCQLIDPSQEINTTIRSTDEDGLTDDEEAACRLDVLEFIMFDATQIDDRDDFSNTCF